VYPLLQKLNRSAVICSQVLIGYSCVGVSMTLTVSGSICVICESLLKKFMCQYAATVNVWHCKCVTLCLHLESFALSAEALFALYCSC